MATDRQILTVNAGSSSIKLAGYRRDGGPRRVFSAQLAGIGTAGADFASDFEGAPSGGAVEAPDLEAATRLVLAWLDERRLLDRSDAVGHRVVHGFERDGPARVTPALLDELEQAAGFAPQHLPAAIRLMRALAARAPGLPQVACFDTAFHHGMPRVATLLPLPWRYQAQGLRRYGFHGLSCAYLIEELARVAGPAAAQGRVLLAHLGNGASLTAVTGGRSADTSMGFTPAAGLVMSTRTGDLDPGVLPHLARTGQMTAEAFDRLVHQESGLLGVSGVSSDMRELLARETADSRAADAVALFCYQARKWIGAMAAAIGGVDTLVFAGGICERSAAIRARICTGLGFLGLALDAGRNAAHAPVISTAASPVTVRVMPTDEEVMIARAVERVLDADVHQEVRDR